MSSIHVLELGVNPIIDKVALGIINEIISPTTFNNSVNQSNIKDRVINERYKNAQLIEKIIKINPNTDILTILYQNCYDSDKILEENNKIRAHLKKFIGVIPNLILPQNIKINLTSNTIIFNHIQKILSKENLRIFLLLELNELMRILNEYILKLKTNQNILLFKSMCIIGDGYFEQLDELSKLINHNNLIINFLTVHNETYKTTTSTNPNLEIANVLLELGQKPDEKSKKRRR